MRTFGPAARAVLAVLGMRRHAIAANQEFLTARLNERGIEIERTALRHILKRLEEAGKIVKITSVHGGVAYVLPRNLKRPGYRRGLEDFPKLDIRLQAEWPEKKVRRRKERAVRRWQDILVTRGGHDHRPNRKCPKCGVITPKIWLAK